MAHEIAKNVPNFLPMGAIAGQRVKPEDVELDAEGKPVNPHIPQFIAKAPWYLDSGDGSSLKHQRRDEQKERKEEWYARGARGPQATKYRKGACENCGAATHRTKDCLERPRKKGAKWSGRDIQADEVIRHVDLSWSAKRDTANGYDFDSHKVITSTKEDEPLAEDSMNPTSITDQTKEKTNTHMRIREDTASYLMKGSEGTYDPKTRTSKESIDKQGFTRGSDATAFDKLQSFAWLKDSQKNAFGEVHPQATPSQAALIYKQAQEARERAKSGVLEKYGSDAKPLPDHLIEEQQREYTSSGVLITKSVQSSKYPEDVLTNGHTFVFGSSWDAETQQWCYKCCRSTLKNAYCTA